MLEFYFKSPWRLEQMRSGPWAEHIGDLAAKLYRRGFTRATGRRILSLTGRFNGFAAGAGVEEAAGIDEALLERFINEELRAEGTFKEAGSLLRHMLEHLRSEGVIHQAAVARSQDRFASVLGNYDRYLEGVRGLSVSSRPQYLRYTRRLLDWLCDRHGERPLAQLTGADVLDFITDNIVRKHLLRAGIRSPSQGAHLLRHSLATRMVNEGVTVKQIADLLGHVSIDSTAIYTKVDTRHLSAVALPFPGGAP